MAVVLFGRSAGDDEDLQVLFCPAALKLCSCSVLLAQRYQASFEFVVSVTLICKCHLFFVIITL